MSPDVRSARLSLGFSSIGHTYSHLFQPLYFVTALTLEGELGLTHDQTTQLIVLGAVLFGLAAPLAGWLGDRWGALPMMAIYFFGTGVGMILTGLAEEAWQIMAALGLTGLFASIYHPVGIAWLIKNSLKRGMAIGINGIFGGFGPAIAALTAGGIIALFGWRAVFILPGVLIIVTGTIFLILVARGLIVDQEGDRLPPPPRADKADAMRVFVALAMTMLCAGMIFQASQAAFPKTFQLTLSDHGVATLEDVYPIVSIVFFMAGLMQVIGGWLADKFQPRMVYVCAFFIQIPTLVLIGHLGGPAVVLIAIVLISVNNGSQPAENMILARFVPPSRRALAFGFKFVIAIGFGALGTQIHATLFGLTEAVFWTYMVLGCCAVIGAMAAMSIPAVKPSPQPQSAE